MTTGDGAKEGLAALRIEPEDRGSRRRGRGRSIAVAAVLAALALAVAVLVLGRPPEVEVAAVEPAGDGAGAVLNASGYVEPRRRATVAAKVTGRVVEVLVDEGMRVQAGQLLARLDDADARRRLDAARAAADVARAAVRDYEVNLTDARRTLRRVGDLRAGDVASQDDEDRARTAVESLEARLALARDEVVSADAQVAVAEQDLANYAVRAPFAGVVVSKDAQPGEMVSPISAGGGFTRTGIATIVDMASLEVEVDVNESYIARVEDGQAVTATLDAYPGWEIPARVRTVIPTADRQKATVKVRIAFGELDPRILPDMGVKVAFLAEPDPDAPVVRGLLPRRAVRGEAGSSTVVVVEGGVARVRPVTLGETSGSRVQVLAGVGPGEEVVVAGGDGVADGDRVRVAR